MDISMSNDDILVVLQEVMFECVTFLTILLEYFSTRNRRMSRTLRRHFRKKYSLISRIPKQISRLRDIISLSDVDCISSLRMSRNAFGHLCELVEQIGGLRTNKNIMTSEQLAMFLSILAHHKKNRIVRGYYRRSGRTVSKHFHGVLNAILKLHRLLLVDPVPVPEDESTDRWKWFKGCLGALDGTYIRVMVPASEKSRYRNRKGDIAVNVLAVCDREMKFIYVLSGWEGSAADSRVLRDAVARNNGLRVPRGNYYLCDNGYTNGEGFLTPYRGVRYHLDDWSVGSSAPQNKEEFFNLKHSKARNVIERAFSLLKGRWAILRSPSYYHIKTHNRIIMACCLLHNFIRTVIPYDPQEYENVEAEDTDDGDACDDYVDTVECSQQWSSWRDNLATSMYQEFVSSA